ncbi:MAG: peptidoglycan DD-metalloendopeptidase family protein [Patescibacteria group bacterium]
MKKNFWIIRGVYIAITLLFIFVLSSSVIFSAEIGGNAAEIEQLNQKIEEKRKSVEQIEKTIEEYKQRLREKQTQKASLNNQLAILDNHVTQVELDIEATQKKMEALTLEIEALQLSIEEKERIMAKQKEMIAEFIRTIHEEEGKNFLTVLAAYDTFSDFYSRVQYLERIDRDLGKSVIALKGVREELKTKKDQREERKIAYEKTRTALEEKKKDLKEDVFAKEELLNQTQASEATYTTLLSSLKKQYQQIESEITGIEQEVRKRLEAEERLKNIEEGSNILSWPTQSRYITSYFHDPDYPYRNVFEHSGIDIRASHGTPVKAAASGYIARAKRCDTSRCYSYVMIIHAGGLSTVYGHLSTVLANEEQFVTRGDVIGLSGGTPGTVGAGPFVTGAHLHFEARNNGIPDNPINYLVKE